MVLLKKHQSWERIRKQYTFRYFTPWNPSPGVFLPHWCPKWPEDTGVLVPRNNFCQPSMNGMLEAGNGVHRQLLSLPSFPCLCPDPFLHAHYPWFLNAPIFEPERGVVRMLEGARTFVTATRKSAFLLCEHGDGLNMVLCPRTLLWVG